MKKRKQKLEDLSEFGIDSELRDSMIDRLQQGDNILGKDGIFTDLLQKMVNISLESEMDIHLGNSKKKGVANRRNGHISKQVKSVAGKLSIETPRDRAGDFAPKIVEKRQRQLGDNLESTILSLYAQGNSLEDIRKIMQQIYGLEYSTGAISLITDRIWPEVLAWQQRALDPCYPIIYLDAIHFKVRDQGKYLSKAVYTVYGINVSGERDVLGLYISETEGARHWTLILEDIRSRGVEEVLFFCVDGLKGFKEAIQSVYPLALVQLCIVHMVRNCVKYVSDKDRKAVCKDLRKIYTSPNEQQAQTALESFDQQWGNKYGIIVKKWQEKWDDLMIFLDFPAHIRRMIYTTNPVEALHRIMRKVTKKKGAWVNEKSLMKQLYLSLQMNHKSWKRKAFHWSAIQLNLAEYFGERFTKWT